MRGQSLESRVLQQEGKKGTGKLPEEVTKPGLEGGIGVCKDLDRGRRKGNSVRESSTSKGWRLGNSRPIWILVKGWIRQTAHIVSKKAAIRGPPADAGPATGLMTRYL